MQRDLSNQNSTPQSPNPNAFPTKCCLATHGCIMGSQRHALSPQKSSKRCSSRSAENVMAASALPFAPHEAAARSYLPFTLIKAKMQDKQSGIRIFHRKNICNIDIIVIFSQFAPIFFFKIPVPVSSHYADVLWDFQFANVCAVEGTTSAALLRLRPANPLAFRPKKSRCVTRISDCSSSMDRLAVQGVGILR